jgi:thiol-disulfide isomerase/thioredoxin
MKHFIWILFLGLNAFAQQLSVPDFKVESVSKTSELNAWVLYLAPPAKHHFNIKAPMKATIASKQIDFIVQEAKESKITFERANAAIAASDAVDISVFLCDDAKTYCIKKTQSVVLASVLNASLETTAVKVPNGTMGKSFLRAKPPQRMAQAARTQAVTGDLSENAQGLETGVDEEHDVVETVDDDASTSVALKKDAHGFWNNNISAALNEAVKKKKPLLIDFYGIWCPPCNQYNESVFPTPKFQKAAKHFVLLKVDADKNLSWELKSHFKVGGYPTLIFVKTPANTQIANLEEIDRLIGFVNADETAKQVNAAYANRAETLDEKMTLAKSSYLIGLEKQIEVKYEKQEFAEVIKLADEGHQLNADDLFFRIVKLQATTSLQKTDPTKDELAAGAALLKEIWQKRATASVDTLMRAVTFTQHQAERLANDADKREQLTWALDDLSTLQDRINPATLNVDNHELSIADLDDFRIDAYTAMHDDAGVKRARASGITSYQKLIAHYRAADPRGLNLELAYLYREDGQYDKAKTIYEHFIQKYPHEFTFYYPAAKLYLEQKDLPKARDDAEKAVKYGYGDNQLRAEDLLLKIMIAQGEKPQALKRGHEFLASAQSPKDYVVRTQHYLDAIQKTLKEIESKE